MPPSKEPRCYGQPYQCLRNMGALPRSRSRKKSGASTTLRKSEATGETKPSRIASGRAEILWGLYGRRSCRCAQDDNENRQPRLATRARLAPCTGERRSQITRKGSRNDLLLRGLIKP